MPKVHVKTYMVIPLLLWVALMTACGGVPRHIQIAQRENLTLEEKLQQLVYRGASRTEVLATLGSSTGYTQDTLSYTVSVTDTGSVQILRFPVLSIGYPDSGHPGYYRWVLKFDEHGSLYDYRRVPIDRAEATRVYEYLRDKIHMAAGEWHGAYRTGFAALQCRDTAHCWAVGGAGLVLETTDGGKSWANHLSGTDRYKRLPSVVPSLYAAAFPDRMNGWLTGHDSLMPVGGLILHSADGGENWQFQLKSDSAWRPRDFLSSIAFSGNRQGWVVGGRGTILHTSDGGSTWAGQSSETKAALLSVAFCDGQSGWAVGSSWTILHTSDGGQSWHPQAIRTDQLPMKTPEGKPFPWLLPLFIDLYEDVLTSVNVIDCRQGWVAGDHGAIFHTEDGGTTWRAQLSGTTERLNAVQFISAHQGWAVGDRGVILRTINGGQDWMTQSSGTREDLRDLSFVDENHGWVGGSYGIILHTADGGKTWAKQCLVYDCAVEAAQQFYWQPWLK